MERQPHQNCNMLIINVFILDILSNIRNTIFDYQQVRVIIKFWCGCPGRNGTEWLSGKAFAKPNGDSGKNRVTQRKAEL